MRSEAHLPASRRTIPLVRHVPRPRRSLAGWVLFLGLILINEVRGVYVAKEAWQAFFGG